MSHHWSNSCVSARILAQERKRVSRGGFFVSTRRHRTRNRTRRSSRASGLLGHNRPHHVWIKWLQKVGCSGSSHTRLLTRVTLASHLTHEAARHRQRHQRPERGRRGCTERHIPCPNVGLANNGHWDDQTPRTPRYVSRSALFAHCASAVPVCVCRSSRVE